MEAKVSGRQDSESRLLSTRAPPQGWRPLHSAASAGHEPVATLLVSLGADVDAATAQQRTALHYAASKGHAGIAKLLLQAGAEANAKDCTGATPVRARSVVWTPVHGVWIG